MKKIIFTGTLILSALFLTSCDETVDKSIQSAEEIKNIASEFNSLVEQSGVEGKIKDLEQQVVSGITSAVNITVEHIRNNNNKVPTAKSGSELMKATIKNVIDGDTVVLDGTHEKVRLILVNTPESKGEYEHNPQPFALEAASFTEKILNGTTVWLEKGVQERDQYGRLLAYVWLGDISYEMNGEKRTFENITMNELLLYEGLAKVAVYPPNTQYLDEFTATEEEAKKNRRGMWTE